MFLCRRRLPFLPALAQGRDEEIVNAHRIIRLLLAAALLAAATAQAAMPPMPEIPVSLPDAVRDPLIAKRHPLALKKLALIEEGEANKKQCTNVVVGSPQHQSCLAKLQEFNAKVDALRVEFNQLEDEIDAAVVAEEKRQAAIAAEAKRQADIAAEKMRRAEDENKRRAALNTDTSVVDARNVPSGLPKSVDDAIPHTPSGERVRKGFQAIQDGDWKAALAWFKDAHNKEPGNPGIERLVDLAQFTLEYRTKATTPAVEKKSTSAQSVYQKSTDRPTGAAQVKPVTPEDKSANSIEHAAASQMAARARADEARKRYEEKYGDRNVAGRASAVAKAAQGEGYSNEELKAQLQKALMDYRKNHPKGSAKSVGGTPAVNEISIGGKG